MSNNILQPKPGSFTFCSQEELDFYGIDWDGPLPSETWGSSTHDGEIVIPQIDITISHDQFALLQENINPLGQTENFGIDIFENTLNFLQNLLTPQACSH